MVMTYVGAVKTWLLWPLLKLFRTIACGDALADAGGRNGLHISILPGSSTASDSLDRSPGDGAVGHGRQRPSTSVFDWGPVALQHLFLTFALYGGISFAQERQRRWLIAACFAVGLGLWDKAISIWLLGGFGAALLLVYPRQMWQLAKSPRTVVPAVLAFVLGCSPLIYYNWVKPLKTFTSDVSVGNEDYLMKISQVDTAPAGDGLRGYLTRPQAGPKPQDLKIWERAALKLEFPLRFPRRSLQAVLIALSLLATPLLLLTPHRRVILWVVLGLALTCLVMFSTHRAGGGFHHTILLWPMFHVIVAIGAAELFRWRPRIVAAVLLGGMVSNLIVMDAMLADFARSGTSVAWTDAIRGLMRVAGNDTKRMVAGTKWGILEQVRYFSEGRIGYYPGSDGWLRELNVPSSRASAELAIELDTTLWIGHARAVKCFPIRTTSCRGWPPTRASRSACWRRFGTGTDVRCSRSSIFAGDE